MSSVIPLSKLITDIEYGSRRWNKWCWRFLLKWKKRKSIVSIRKRPWRWRRRRRRRLQMKYVERKVFGTFVKKFTYATAKRRKFIERNFELLNCVLNWWFNNSNLICALKTLHAISFLNPPRHIPFCEMKITHKTTLHPYQIRLTLYVIWQKIFEIHRKNFIDTNSSTNGSNLDF